jgi:hypothetical protein
VERTEHVEGLVVAVELVLVQVDRRNPRRHAALCGRSVEECESGEGCRRFVEVTPPNVYLSEKCESPYVVRVEHRHMLE